MSGSFLKRSIFCILFTICLQVYSQTPSGPSDTFTYEGDFSDLLTGSYQNTAFGGNSTLGYSVYVVNSSYLHHQYYNYNSDYFYSSGAFQSGQFKPPLRIRFHVQAATYNSTLGTSLTATINGNSVSLIPTPANNAYPQNDLGYFTAIVDYTQVSNIEIKLINNGGVIAQKIITPYKPTFAPIFLFQNSDGWVNQPQQKVNLAPSPAPWYPISTYKANGAAFAGNLYPPVGTNWQEGTNSVTFSMVDNQNISSDPVAKVFKVDSIPPAIAATPVPTGWLKSDSPAIPLSFSVADSTSGVKLNFPVSSPTPAPTVNPYPSPSAAPMISRYSVYYSQTQVSNSVDPLLPISSSDLKRAANLVGLVNPLASGANVPSVSKTVTLTPSTMNSNQSGYYYLLVEASDVADNQATLVMGPVKYDTTVLPPTVTAQILRDSAYQTFAGPTKQDVRLLVQAQDSLSGLNSVQLLLNGSPVGLTPTGNTGEWSANVSTEGVSNFAVTATDNAGNVSTATSGQFTIDKTNPTLKTSVDNIPIENASVQFLSASTQKTLKIEASDSIGIDASSFQIKDNGSPLAKSLAAGIVTVTLGSNGEVQSVGPHVLEMSVSDGAGNQVTRTLTFTITAQAISLGSSTDSKPYFKYFNSSAIESTVTSTPINATSLGFAIPQTDVANGNFAPPVSVAVIWNGQTTILPFTLTGGEYVSASLPVDALVSDGSQTLSYVLTDASGLATPSTVLAFSLHRQAPAALTVANLLRASDSSIWTKKPDGSWQIASTSVSLAVASDGVSFQYSNDPNNSAGFDLAGYHVSVDDSTVGSQVALLSLSQSYKFAWGSESSRAIKLTLISESGVSSPSLNVQLVKPVAAQFDPFQKVSSQQSFQLIWSNISAPSGWTANVQWDDSASSATYGYSLLASGGTAGLNSASSGLIVGSTVHSRLAMTSNSDSFALTVLSDPRLQTIDYEPLPALTAPTFAFVGASGTADVPPVSLSAADGTNINYALKWSIPGSSEPDRYTPVQVTDSSFPYDFYSLYQAADSAALQAIFAQGTVRVELLAWYGDPIESGETAPAGKVGSPAIAVSTSQTVSVDLLAPAFNLTGMMAQNSGATNSSVVSGSATDTGASLLKSVVVTVTTDDAQQTLVAQSQKTLSGSSDNFSLDLSLTGGAYRVQVQVYDRAGNVHSISKSIFFDAQAPGLASFQWNAFSSSGVYLAQADGAIWAHVSTQENSGSGLTRIDYQWAGDTDWKSFDVRPKAPMGAGLQQVDVPFAAESGQKTLTLRLIDAAGNVSADFTDPQWVVSYSATVPQIASVGLSPVVRADVGLYVAAPNSLHVTANPVTGFESTSLRWRVVEKTSAGEVKTSTWSAWSSPLDSARSLVTTNGSRYRIQVQGQSVNGIFSAIVSSEEFVLDSVGPSSAVATLSSSSAVAGGPIEVQLNAVHPFGPVVWKLVTLRTDQASTPAESPFVEGQDLVLGAVGDWSVYFVATGANGMSSTTSATAIHVDSAALVVRDDRRFVASDQTASGRWEAFQAFDRVEYRWKTQQGTTLTNWADAVGKSWSSLDLSGFSLVNAARVILEVRAFDQANQVVAQAQSLGQIVDSTPPTILGWNVPRFASAHSVTAALNASDPESGVENVAWTVRKLNAANGTWESIFQSTTAWQPTAQFDLSAFASTGDSVIVEASVFNKAGSAQSVTSSVVTIDDTAPPVPVVFEMADAVNPNQPGGVEYHWEVSENDPESPTVYEYQLYTSLSQLDSGTWTTAPAGNKFVSNLDLTSYPDGSVVYMAVRATNAVGLSSVGYSRATIVDSTAPVVQTVKLFDKNGQTVGSYARLTDLTDSQGKSSVQAQVKVDSLSGVASVTASASSLDGTQFPETNYEPTAEQRFTENQYNLDLSLVSAAPGSIVRVKGKIVNAAGNVASVLYSSGFKIVGSLPVLTGLTGQLGNPIVNFAWSAQGDFGVVQGYRLNLKKISTDGSILPLVTNLITTDRTYSFDWRAAGLLQGEKLGLTVELLTALGVSNAMDTQVTIDTFAPELASFQYSSYFSNHMNVKELRYSNAGVSLIQWRVRNAQTGGVLQDWTNDYSGLAAKILLPFVRFQTAPAQSDRIFIEARAKAWSGLWSSTTPSATIGIDQTSATGITISRSNPYSNAPDGTIGGWNLAAQDGESGLLAYQTVLIPSTSVTNPVDWSNAATKSISGTSLLQAGISVASVASDGTYVAALRVQNGTEDWSDPVLSAPVSVDRTKPAVSFRWAPSVFVRDAQNQELAVKVTNLSQETVSVESNKSGTTYAVSVNGLLQPSTDGSFAVSTPNQTASISVTATDLYGNQSTIEDRLRFNDAPSISILRTATTSLQPLNLEQLVDVLDASADYPLKYRWTLGGGEGLGGFDSSPYFGSATSNWTGPFHQARFKKSTTDSVQTYNVVLTVEDSWGKSTSLTLPIQVKNTAEGRLWDNETWVGDHTLTGIVQVPAGFQLTLSQAHVVAAGGVANGVLLNSGITIDASASMDSTDSTIESQNPGFYFRGIDVKGTWTAVRLSLRGAERALILHAGASASANASILQNNLIGLHLLGGTLVFDSGQLLSNKEYAVKEDGAGSFTLRQNQFIGNTVDYYERAKTGLSLDEVNALGGNGGNQ